MKLGFFLTMFLAGMQLSAQGVNWDLSAVQAAISNGTPFLINLIPGLEPHLVTGTVQGPAPFATLSSGTYRVDGILGPGSGRLSLTQAISSANGLTVRMVVTTKAYTGDPVAGNNSCESRQPIARGFFPSGMIRKAGSLGAR